METADMVKVAVSAAPYSIDKPYSYLVPDALAAAAVPGVRVMVPFGRGNKESEGLILARVQEPKLPGSKALRQVLWKIWSIALLAVYRFSGQELKIFYILYVIEKRCKKSYAENRKARTVKGRGANTVLWL